MLQAVDYSWARPGARAIKDAGYVGALRYLSYEPAKNISPAEVAELHAADLSIGLVWETTANMMLRGAAGGAADSILANQQADAIGFPADRPIYYACDFNPSQDDFLALDAYMRAVTGRPSGVYGTYSVAEYFGERGWQYIWQCAAWSRFGSGSGGSAYSPADNGNGRRLSKYTTLYQHVGYVLNNTSDFNDIYRDDWGQWPYNSTPGGDDMLDQNDKDFITNAIRDAVRPVVLNDGEGHKYLWNKGLPVPTGDAQIQTVANLMGAPQELDVSPVFIWQMREGVGCITSGTPDAAALATAIVDQLGDDLAKEVADELAERLAN